MIRLLVVSNLKYKPHSLMVMMAQKTCSDNGIPENVHLYSGKKSGNDEYTTL